MGLSLISAMATGIEPETGQAVSPVENTWSWAFGPIKISTQVPEPIVLATFA